MYYKVANATSAVTAVDDYSGSARLLAATTLRNVLGTKNLCQLPAANLSDLFPGADTAFLSS
jgi:hypothetical protein